MSVTLKYQGKTVSKTDNNTTTKQIYQGFQSQIDAYISGNLSGMNQWYEGKGYLQTWTKTQDQGPIYNVEATYSSFLGYPDMGIDDDSIYPTLDTRTIQLPLAKLSTYKYNWDHFLLACSPSSVMLPSMQYAISAIWQNAKTDKLEGGLERIFKWSNFGAVATDGNSAGNIWRTYKQPTKPGVKYFDYSTFVVTETQKYSTKNKAAQKVKKNINHLICPQNTFGITPSSSSYNRNWKLDSSSISYDGKHWLVRSVYTYSQLNGGWDTDLYVLGS